MEIESKHTGSSLTATEFNQIPDELENLITKSGLTPSSSDLTQLTKAVAQMVGDSDFYSTSGTANAIVLSAVAPRLAPSSLSNGLRVRFKATYANTGTVTVNVNNLGAKYITVGGTNIGSGKLEAGKFYDLTYSTSTTSFELFENTVGALPSQTGNTGKYLTTNGTTASWDGSVLTNNKLANCILEDTQNINLELDSSTGTLTLKAGSVVCVPNGLDSDSNKIFNEVTIASDLTTTFTSGARTLTLYCRADGSALSLYAKSADSTGTTAPSGSVTFYNTSTNYINRYSSGTQGNQYSFPIATITSNATQISSIDQIFQSIGYMYDTVFVRKGLNGLAPNGRNSDRTLKNTEVTSSSVMTSTLTGSNDLTLFFNSSGIGSLGSAYTYDEVNNYNLNGGTIYAYCPIATCTTTSGAISNFKPYQPVNLVKYSDLTEMPAVIIKTYVSGTSGYRIWSDGYCVQWGLANCSGMVTLTFLKTFADTNANIQAVVYSQTQDNATMHCKQISTTQFVIGGGSANYAYWQASGYLATGQY